jgi:competence protein ComEC
MVAPHHGSHSSSSTEFIAAVSPRYVFYPVGYLNRFHFPHSDVLRRYAKRQVQAMDSAKNGAILMTLGDGGDSKPQGYRQLAHRYWQRQPVQSP